MRRHINKTAVVVLLALTTLFLVAGPAHAAHRVIATPTLVEYQASVIHAYKMRDKVQIANYFSMKRQIKRLNHKIETMRLQAAASYNAGYQDGLSSLELSPVTLSMILDWEAHNIGYGKLYVTP